MKKCIVKINVSNMPLKKFQRSTYSIYYNKSSTPVDTDGYEYNNWKDEKNIEHNNAISQHSSMRFHSQLCTVITRHH